MQEVVKRLGGVRLESVGMIYLEGRKSTIKYWLIGVTVLAMMTLFLPWTQNIRAKGLVTSRRQEQRPQEINTIIAGKITKWYVKEGDVVKKGDTLVQLGEIKDSYLDPAFVERTSEQLDAKKGGLEAYKQKQSFIDAQIAAMENNLQIKTGQLQRKIVSDSMEMNAANTDFKIAEEQYRRIKIMRDSGLASTMQVEQRNQYLQAALAKKTSAQIKYRNTCSELTQAKQDYLEKMMKASSEKASVSGELATGNAEIAKLSNQLTNYTIRNGMYYILAPQDGQIVQANKAGINEIVKEGEKIAEIVPDQNDLAVEMFVKPVDLQLLKEGQTVRFLFDGFPAIVFSGWPQASYGTFEGTIVAIENAADEKGKFRVLVSEGGAARKWPPGLRIGTGAQCIALLKSVPIWYELWRNINGFPPEYYEKQKAKSDDKYKK